MTPKPILYYGLRSPASRAVLMVAAELGLDLELHDLVASDPEVTKRNPLKTLPVLDDNGTIIIDSHVINAYLVDKYGKDDKLYPKDPEKRRRVDTLLFFDACHLFPRTRLTIEPILAGGATEFDDFFIKHLNQAYDMLENRFVGDTRYLCGDHMTIADLHAVTSITSAVVASPLSNEKHAKTLAWIELMSKLPYYERINLAGIEVLQGFIREAIEANMKAKSDSEICT